VSFIKNVNWRFIVANLAQLGSAGWFGFWFVRWCAIGGTDNLAADLAGLIAFLFISFWAYSAVERHLPVSGREPPVALNGQLQAVRQTMTNVARYTLDLNNQVDSLTQAYAKLEQLLVERTRIAHQQNGYINRLEVKLRRIQSHLDDRDQPEPPQAGRKEPILGRNQPNLGMEGAPPRPQRPVDLDTLADRLNSGNTNGEPTTDVPRSGGSRDINPPLVDPH
jgi:hypothetical protein